MVVTERMMKLEKRTEANISFRLLRSPIRNLLVSSDNNNQRTGKVMKAKIYDPSRCRSDIPSWRNAVKKVLMLTRLRSKTTKKIRDLFEGFI